MSHKKKVTDAVLAANRVNSQSSTGPSTKHGKSHSSKNAVRHGVLARNVVLDTHKQRAEFRGLRKYCETDLRPKGLVEKLYVEEIVNILWKLGIVEGLEVRELLRRQELSNGVDNIFPKDIQLPVSGYDLPQAISRSGTRPSHGCASCDELTCLRLDIGTFRADGSQRDCHAADKRRRPSRAWTLLRSSFRTSPYV
jgi:hypothetical protein